MTMVDVSEQVQKAERLRALHHSGTILVLPLLWQLVSVPSGGATLPSGGLDDPAFGGAEAFLQQLQLDAGASKGVSFSEGHLKTPAFLMYGWSGWKKG